MSKNQSHPVQVKEKEELSVKRSYLEDALLHLSCIIESRLSAFEQVEIKKAKKIMQALLNSNQVA